MFVITVIKKSFQSKKKSIHVKNAINIKINVCLSVLNLQKKMKKIWSAKLLSTKCKKITFYII